jgi:hypothetical protein
MGLQTAFNLVDAYIIARLPSDVSGPSLGAIGICDQLAALGTIISYGISVAAASMVSRAWGRGDKDEARRIAWQSGLLVLGLGIVLALVGGLGARTLLTNVIGVKGQVAERGADYLSVVMGGGVTMFLMLHCASLLRAVGSAKTPVFLLVLGNVINFFFAVLFVYGPGDAPAFLAWGPAAARALHVPRLELLGAGIATLLARAVVLLPLAFFAAKRLGFVSRATALVPDRAVITQVLRLAWPSSAELVLRMCAMLLTHALVARAFTTATDQSATTALVMQPYGEPKRLACYPNGPNTKGTTFSPSLVTTPDGTLLFYSSNHNGVAPTGSQDIFVSEMAPDGSFGPGKAVASLNTASEDQQPNVARDGLSIVFASNRGGNMDIYIATRAKLTDDWSAPRNLSVELKFPTAASAETRPSLSWDLQRLYYGADGQAYTSTRAKTN